MNQVDGRVGSRSRARAAALDVGREVQPLLHEELAGGTGTSGFVTPRKSGIVRKSIHEQLWELASCSCNSKLCLFKHRVLEPP